MTDVRLILSALVSSIALGCCISSAGAYSLVERENSRLDFRTYLSYGIFHSEETYNQGGPVEPGGIGWCEGVARYGLWGSHVFSGAPEISIYGEIGAISGATWGSGDAGGYNNGTERESALDRAYIGIKSGNAFPHLRRDGVQLSVGMQKIQVGDGFLINGDGISLGNNLTNGLFNRSGSLYLVIRNAFAKTAWLHLGADGPWRADLIWLKSDQRLKAKPELAIAVLERHHRLGMLGVTHFRGLDVDARYANAFSAQRGGMKVTSLRGAGNPGMAPLRLHFEYARQSKRSGHETAWYAESGWQFARGWGKPVVSMRRTRYSEDYDTMFSGYSRGFGTWFQGEVAINYTGPVMRNAVIDQIRMELTPGGSWDFGVIGHRFRTLDDRTQDNFDAWEVDTFVNFNPFKGLIITPVLGLYKPKLAAEDGGAQQGSTDLNVYSQIIFEYAF